jgi:hypothetical protein
VDADIASTGTACADGILLAQVPDAALKAKLPFGEGPNGTDVNHISGIGVVQHSARIKINDGPVSAVEDAQFIGLGNLLAKTGATSAEDTAFLIQNNMGPDDGSLFRLVFIFEESAVMLADFHVEVLEVAFTCLITDGAIQGMIDQEKFEHGPASVSDLVGISADLHAFLDLSVASDGQLGHVFDFDQAHPATSGDGKPGMVAVAGDIRSEFFSGLNHGGPRFYLDLLLINGDDWQFYSLSSTSHFPWRM